MPPMVCQSDALCFVNLFLFKQLFGDDLRLAVFDPPEKTAPVSFVTGGRFLNHLDQHAVGVAVEIDLLHFLRVAGGLPLHPHFFARAGIEGDKGAFQGFFHRLAVHPADHQDLVVLHVLNHGGDEAVGVELHFVYERVELTHAFSE